jgi:DNA polymerase III subunit chi
MTQVEFHQLDDADAYGRDRYGCLLAHQCYQRGQRVHIQARDAGHARLLDQLLWSFRDNSFLPHAACDAPADAPVTIGHAGQSPRCDDVMINLDDQVPEFFSCFQQIYEIVIDEPGARQVARDHYRFYRDRGLPLQHLAIPATAR